MRGLFLQGVLGVVCTALFAYAAREEQEPQWLWGGLSLVLWLLCWLVLGGGVLLTLTGQGALFAAMWAYLVLRARQREGTGIRR